MAAAQTGTAKRRPHTACSRCQEFWASGPKDVSCLILTPTRELAAQIADNIGTYGAGIKPIVRWSVAV